VAEFEAVLNVGVVGRETHEEVNETKNDQGYTPISRVEQEMSLGSLVTIRFEVIAADSGLKLVKVDVGWNALYDGGDVETISLPWLCLVVCLAISDADNKEGRYDEQGAANDEPENGEKIGKDDEETGGNAARNARPWPCIDLFPSGPGGKEPNDEENNSKSGHNGTDRDDGRHARILHPGSYSHLETPKHCC